MEAATPEPQAIVQRLLADPPVVHIVDTPDGKQPGVWSTEDSCYRFIAQVVGPDSRTLETGSGLSTALFAALGTEHTCITPAEVEAEHLRRYFAEKGIPGDRVSFILAPSHLALPELTGQVDLVLIDGAHGYPMPIIDWFYAGGLLRRGGTLIVDDVPLPGVGALMEFLASDARWERQAQGERWVAFRRLAEGPLVEGQWEQAFYMPDSARVLARRLAARVGQRVRTRVAEHLR